MDILSSIGGILSKASEILKSDAAQQVIKSVANSSKDGQVDISAGLRKALEVGIKEAASKLGAENGYFSDLAVRIGIPQGAVTTFDAVQSMAASNAFNSLLNATGVSVPKKDQVIKLFNSAAENAAPKSVDIFVNAITGMSIDDAKGLLFGGDNAATAFLKQNTQTKLVSAFTPSIDSSLSSVKIANITPLQAWQTFAEYNNKFVDILDSNAGKLALEVAKKTGVIKEEYIAAIDAIDKVDSNISGFITNKALDGLFLKVGEKEVDIRHNVSARVDDTLKNVFGLLDQKK